MSWTRLVLALGSGSNAFGTPGIEHAYLLENVQDAQRFHTDWLGACARAAFSESRTLAVAIVGAGATGVELSAELLEAHAELLESLGQHQRFRLDITLLEAGERILGGLPERISTQAEQALRHKLVQVLTRTQVTEIRPGALQTSAGEIRADLIVWAAGIKAADSNAGLGLTVNRINQLVVKPTLETVDDPSIFAIGDCAACQWLGGPENQPYVPARAQAAHQQASHLVGQIDRRLAGQPLTEWRYRDFGSLVSLGRYSAVGNLMGSLTGRKFWVEGFVARMMYRLLYKQHQIALHGYWKVTLETLAGLITRRTEPQIKLH